jgi:hypothetical protein
MNKVVLVFLVSGLVLGAALPAAAIEIDSVTLRLNAGAGYTIIDLPTAFDWDPDYLEDWDYTDIKVNVQGLFLDLGRLEVGAELGWTRLYYYHFRVPGPTNYYGSVGPVNISVLGSLELFRNFYVQAAAGPYIFNDGVTGGISASGVYTIPIGTTMAIPISAFADVVFGDGIPVSFGATVGFQYLLALGR